MKILITQNTDWFKRNPAQQHHLAEMLSLRGHEIRAIDFELLWRAQGEKELFSKKKVFQNVSKIHDNANVTIVRPGIIKAPLLDYLSLGISYQKALKQQIEEFEPDIIVGFSIFAYLSGKVAKANNIPFIYYWIDVSHRLIPFKFLQPIGWMLERQTLKMADRVLTINDKLSDYVVKLGADPEQTQVLGAGINLDKLDPNKYDGSAVRKQYGFSQDDIVLFFMGWLYNFSGLKEVAIELSKIKDNNPKIKLLIVGEGDAFDDLQKIREKYHLNEQVILTGKQPYEEIPGFIAAADICLLPAYPTEKIMQDIVPIKLYEYMAMGKPVIATKLPGIMKEFGEDHGVIYIDKTEDVLKKAIELIENGRIEEEGRRARKFVEKLSWDSITDEFEEVLEGLYDMAKTAKVLIPNITHFANKGSMGRIEGMLRCLEETLPGCKVTILHRYYKQDKDGLGKRLREKYPRLELKKHPWYRESNLNVLTALGSFARFCFFVVFGRLFPKLLMSSTDNFDKHDVIVDLNLIEPDKLTDEYDLVSTAGNLFSLLNIWYATMARKPVIVCSATIGPYQNKFLRQLAKHALNKVNIITLREEYSQDYLQSIGVDKPHIYLTADLAFLMEPPIAEKIPAILENMNITSDDRPLVGIAPTAMMHSALKQPQYIQLIAELTDFLIEDLNATIIYVTNTYQDAPITQNIYQKVKNKHKVRILPFNVSASETKGIIGICDVFICSRFHALVASTSLGVPSLGIVAYSRNKFHGIIGKMMGMEDYLLDVDDGLEYDAFLAELKSKVNDLLMNKDLIAKELKEQAKKVREQTLLNGKLIKELMESSLLS